MGRGQRVPATDHPALAAVQALAYPGDLHETIACVCITRLCVCVHCVRRGEMPLDLHEAKIHTYMDKSTMILKPSGEVRLLTLTLTQTLTQTLTLTLALPYPHPTPDHGLARVHNAVARL